MFAAKQLVKGLAKSIAPAVSKKMVIAPVACFSSRKSTPLLHSVVVLASGPDDKDILSVFTSQISKLNVRNANSKVERG